MLVAIRDDCFILPIGPLVITAHFIEYCVKLATRAEATVPVDGGRARQDPDVEAS